MKEGVSVFVILMNVRSGGTPVRVSAYGRAEGGFVRVTVRHGQRL